MFVRGLPVAFVDVQAGGGPESGVVDCRRMVCMFCSSMRAPVCRII